MPFSDLPNEILEIAVSHFVSDTQEAAASLRCISRVNRRLRPIAQKVSFQRLDVVDDSIGCVLSRSACRGTMASMFGVAGFTTWGPIVGRSILHKNSQNCKGKALAHVRHLVVHLDQMSRSVKFEQYNKIVDRFAHLSHITLHWVDQPHPSDEVEKWRVILKGRRLQRLDLHPAVPASLDLVSALAGDLPALGLSFPLRAWGDYDWELSTGSTKVRVEKIFLHMVPESSVGWSPCLYILDLIAPPPQLELSCLQAPEGDVWAIRQWAGSSVKHLGAGHICSFDLDTANGRFSQKLHNLLPVFEIATTLSIGPGMVDPIRNLPKNLTMLHLGMWHREFSTVKGDVGSAILARVEDCPTQVLDVRVDVVGILEHVDDCDRPINAFEFEIARKLDLWVKAGKIRLSDGTFGGLMKKIANKVEERCAPSTTGPAGQPSLSE